MVIQVLIMFKAKKKDGNTVNFIEDFGELAKVILVITIIVFYSYALL